MSISHASRVVRARLPILSSALLVALSACSQQVADQAQPDASLASDATSLEHVITSFTFRAADNPGLTVDAVGDISAPEISVSVPRGTDLTSLIPTVTYLGEALTPASGTPQDFSAPVSYIVTAADGSIGSYRVSVQPLCADGLTLCDADCVDVQSSDASCGACGYACPSDEHCDAGVCVGACPTLDFPSVSLRTVPAPDSLLAEYASLSDTSCNPMPRCFIDTDNIIDAHTGERLDTSVHLSSNLTLSDFVHTELESWGPYVLVAPSIVEVVQAIRSRSGRALAIVSGYRSPAHQREVCRSMCGADSCPGCERVTRHEWGDAVDLEIAPEHYSEYRGYARDAGAGTCLDRGFHIDTRPCALGCPP